MRPVAVLLTLLAALVAAPAAAAQDVIVRFERGADAGERTQAREQADTELERTLPVAGMQLLSPEPGTTAREAIAALERSPDVLYAEPDAVRRKTVTPDDSYFDLQWGLDSVDAPEAWDLATGSRDVKVAVVDTGVQLDHPDLQANLLPGRDFVGAGDGDPSDVDGHGTHVAGTIAAAGDNGRGVAGVAWAAGIVPVRVLGDDGSGTLSDVIEGYSYAASSGAQIVNVSLGGDSHSRAECDALAAAPGSLFVVAAGNGGDDGVGDDNDAGGTHPCSDTSRAAGSYPCAYPLPNVVCVASTDRADALSGFSNFGSTSVDLAAPGDRIASTYVGGGYVYLSGTSMATPHVSGVAALVRSLVPGASVAELRAALLEGVDAKPGLSGKVATGGRLNALGSLAAARGDDAQVQDPAPATPAPTTQAPAPAPAPAAPAPAPSTPTPVSPTGAPPPAASAAVQLALSASVRSRHNLRRTLRRGLRVRLRCTTGCRLGARAVVDRRTARRLRLGSGRRSVKVGSASSRLAAAGARTLTVRFGRRSRARLARARSARVTLQLRATDSAGRAKSAKKRVTLR